MGSSNLQQEVLDGIYWVQPPLFVPLDQQMFLPRSQFVQQPAAVLGAPGQQAQDAVTMVTAMWKMMSSMLQQEQRRVYPGYGPGTPGTDPYQTAGTPEVLPDVWGQLALLGSQHLLRFTTHQPGCR